MTPPVSASADVESARALLRVAMMRMSAGMRETRALAARLRTLGAARDDRADLVEMARTESASATLAACRAFDLAIADGAGNDAMRAAAIRARQLLNAGRAAQQRAAIAAAEVSDIEAQLDESRREMAAKAVALQAVAAEVSRARQRLLEVESIAAAAGVIGRAAAPDAR